VTRAAWLLPYLWLMVLSRVAMAQQLEPRAYSPSPVGTNFVVVGFGEINGSVLFDPTLPITDVTADLHTPLVGLGRTFGMFGQQGLVTAVLPYVWGSMQGMVLEQSRSITRSGLANLSVKLSYNLRGSPAMTPQEFARYGGRKVIVGTSVTIDAPTGQYDKTKLVNLGTNRWAFKPELGISYPRKKWVYETYGGIWFFTENSAFYPGTSTRRQDPLPTFQVHVSYTFRPRMWLAFDGTWYGGGATSINDAPPTTRLNNSRAGVTFAFPIRKGQSIKIAYSRGATARIGEKFSSLAVAWQFSWFDRPHSARP